jgi:hypothetical protein
VRRQSVGAGVTKSQRLITGRYNDEAQSGASLPPASCQSRAMMSTHTSGGIFPARSECAPGLQRGASVGRARQWREEPLTTNCGEHPN